MNQIKSEMSYTRKESLDFVQTPYKIGNFLKGYELNLPSNHKTEKYPNGFCRRIQTKNSSSINKRLSSLGGIKFQLGLKVQMRYKDEVRDSQTFYHTKHWIMEDGINILAFGHYKT